MTDKELKVARYRELNKKALKGQIVFAGSSLMEMFPVERLLKEAGYQGVVYNRGVGGFTTAELLDALNPCVLDLAPRRVFINIGTNDLSDASLSMAGIMERYDEILTRIQAALPSVELYTMAYYPVNVEAADPAMREVLLIRTNENISLANSGVRALAKKHGAKYIDVNDALRDELGRLREDYTIEGMHIKEEGYRAIIPALLPFVEE